LGDVVAILPRFTTPFLLLQRTQDVQTSLANSWLANIATQDMLNAIMEARQAATVAQIRKAVAQPATRVMVS
jgi:hypothetical protein